MSALAVRAEKISKMYRIRPTEGRSWRVHTTIGADLVDLAQRLARRGALPGKEAVWAARDVSFEAEEGDVIGLIGRNGAGKSTLLKLLAGITEPTSGQAEIYGRVGSLLEVGTGFHSELTGRQNIYIMGAILGMRQAEIRRKFDEIVAFSGVEPFLDTPVKRYSSGMEVRLAFSVGVHLDPEILLVDEVLSVGDAAFRKKSLEKIREVSHDGRTVLLVSHNMQTVSSLCNSAIVLEQGRVAFPKGNVSNAVDFYHHIVEDKAALRKAAGEKGGQKGYFEVVRFGIYDDAGRPQENVVSGQPVEFRITYAAGGVKRDEDIEVAIGISTFSGNLVSNLESRASHGSLRLVGPQGTLTCRVEKMPLAPGNITISLKITSNGVILSQIEDAFVGMVEAGDFFATGESGKNPGAVFIEQEWAAN